MPKKENQEKENSECIFDLTDGQLLDIIQTNNFPKGISFVGLDQRDDKDLLFKHRHSPKLFAKTILKTRGSDAYKTGTKGQVEYKGTIPQKMREERHALEIRKVNNQEKKLHNQTQMAQDLEKIVVRVDKIDERINIIYRLLHAVLKDGKLLDLQEESP